MIYKKISVEFSSLKMSKNISELRGINRYQNPVPAKYETYEAICTIVHTHGLLGSIFRDIRGRLGGP